MTTLRLLVALLGVVVLAACSTGGGGAPLSQGLSQRMDSPGASLNRAEALGILDATAQALAQQYASTGTSPRMPAGAVTIASSAGYPNFAETFSGWRNSPGDAAILSNRAATRAGVAAVHDPNSAYGVYWVLLLDD